MVYRDFIRAAFKLYKKILELNTTIATNVNGETRTISLAGICFNIMILTNLGLKLKKDSTLKIMQELVASLNLFFNLLEFRLII